MYENNEVSCQATSNKADWQITTLRFFLSDVELRKGDKWYPVSLVMNDWQTGSVGLISLLTPGCHSEQLNNILVFNSDIDLKDADGVRLVLGVPFELNHLNPLQQPSPLNLPAMFWSWQLGHKFLRLDMQSPDGGWAFHLGSIGCQSASRMRSPSQPCAQPNRVSFELPVPNSKQLVLDLDVLLQGIDMDQMQSCMFQSPELPSCEQLLTNLQTSPVMRWQ